MVCFQETPCEQQCYPCRYGPSFNFRDATREEEEKILSSRIRVCFDAVKSSRIYSGSKPATPGICKNGDVQESVLILSLCGLVSQREHSVGGNH